MVHLKYKYSRDEYSCKKMEGIGGPYGEYWVSNEGEFWYVRRNSKLTRTHNEGPVEQELFPNGIDNQIRHWLSGKQVVIFPKATLDRVFGLGNHALSTRKDIEKKLNLELRIEAKREKQ
jgi:hypothetical protein